MALEFARPATYRAAWSLATAQPTLSHDASMAKAMASDAADLAARVALQVHGAIGYTWECDLHFFLKQTWALSRAWGDAATHRRLVLATCAPADSQLRSRRLAGLTPISCRPFPRVDLGDRSEPSRRVRDVPVAVLRTQLVTSARCQGLPDDVPCAR